MSAASKLSLTLLSAFTLIMAALACTAPDQCRRQCRPRQRLRVRHLLLWWPLRIRRRHRPPRRPLRRKRSRRRLRLPPPRQPRRRNPPRHQRLLRRQHPRQRRHRRRFLRLRIPLRTRQWPRRNPRLPLRRRRHLPPLPGLRLLLRENQRLSRPTASANRVTGNGWTSTGRTPLGPSSCSPGCPTASSLVSSTPLTICCPPPDGIPTYSMR